MRSDGTEFPVELVISPMSIGGHTTFTGFIRDISERKRAEEHIQRHIERMGALREIEKSITSTLDLNTVLNVLLEKIEIFFVKSSAATVTLFNKESGLLEPVAARNIAIGEWIAAMRVVPDNQKSYARVVVEQRAPLVITNLQTDSRTQNSDFYRELGLISYVGVPLIAKDEVLGVLGIYTKEEHSFSSEEIELLMVLAGQTAIAIHNARLYDHAQRQLKRIQGVYEINKAITSTLSLKNVLDVLLEQAELFCPVAVACGVRLFDEASGNMVPMASCHIPFEEWKQEVGNAKGGLTAILMETKRPVAILNMHENSRRSVNHFARRHGLISYLGVPLIFREKFMGNLVIYTKEEHAFSEEEIEFFNNLGSQAAIAIHNASLYEQTERRRREAEELAQIGRSLTETLDIVAVGSRIVTSVRELFHVKGASLRNLEADGSLRSLASSGDIFSQTHEGEVIPWNTGLASQALKEERPVWSADISTNEEITLSKSLRDYKLRSGNGSVVVVSLRAHEKITGTLTLTDQTGRTYSENELVLLQTFANQAAMALVNAQLFETIEASKQQLGTTNQFLEHSLNKLSSLYTAMTPLALSESLTEMVNAIIERLIEATGADAALIRIWDRDAGNYPAIGQRGYTDEFVEALRPERAEGAIQWVIKHGKPIIAPDLALEVRFRGKRQVALGFQSSAILPLRVHGDIRGVIQLSSRKQRYFDAEQKDHLMAVARQMSVALENRELFYNLQASRNELERANKVKDEFLNVMSHELRTPLSVVVGYSTMLRGEQLGPLTKEQALGVDVIQRNSKELFTMIDSIMSATKIEAGSMIAEKGAVSPVELLTELKVIYDFPTGKKLRFEWRFSETLPLLWTDGRKLRQILTNLINNAVKFTDEGSVVISAEEKVEENDGCHRHCIEFRVSDSGIGIPAEERDKIFERFHQVDSSTTRSFEGVGLGLYIVKSFTEMLNGRVSVCSEVGRGSTFTVLIPLQPLAVDLSNAVS
jgi:GAF domain-containing protein